MHPVRALLLPLLLLAVPSASWAQGPAGGTGGTQGWSVSVDWGWSFEQNPLGSYFGEATRWTGVRVEVPEVRGWRPTVHWAQVNARGECFLDAPCDEYRAWTLRVGGVSGDLDPNDNSRIAPFLAPEVGIFHSDEGTSFSPGVRAGILFHAVPRVAPFAHVGGARIPWNGWLWEVGTGVRITVF